MATLTRILALALVTAALCAAQDDAARQRRRSPVVEVFEQCRDAVVNISTTRIQKVQMLGYGSLFDELFGFARPYVQEREVHSVGSGVVVHEAGYIVTNHHVIAQASDVRVIFADRTQVVAQVVAFDARHDLAILKVDVGHPLPRVKLARSGDILIGETVIAIGNPLGLDHSVTAGIVSAVGRELHFKQGVSYTGLIQTDAAINPGNSGGPLLNVNAELIGINTAIRGDAQNVGFAIPVARLWQLVPQMLDIERHHLVRFGLEVRDRAAEVIAVHSDSPAARAGVEVGDEVVRIGDHPVRDAIDYYVYLLRYAPGQTVPLTLARDGRTLNISVPLERIPPRDGAEIARRLLGAELSELRLERVAARFLGLDDPGVLRVEKVRPQGPVDRAGIVPGDLIVSVNGLRVTTLEGVGLALQNVRPGQEVDLVGFRFRSYRRPVLWSVRVRTGD